MKATASEILKRARELIANPEHWTTGAFGRDGHGESCPLDMAKSFCALGAIARTQQEFKEKATTPEEHANLTIEAGAAEQDLRDAIRAERDGDGRVTFVNDVLGHAAIIAYFDKAIAGK